MVEAQTSQLVKCRVSEVGSQSITAAWRSSSRCSHSNFAICSQFRYTPHGTHSKDDPARRTIGNWHLGQSAVRTSSVSIALSPNPSLVRVMVTSLLISTRPYEWYEYCTAVSMPCLLIASIFSTLQFSCDPRSEARAGLCTSFSAI